MQLPILTVVGALGKQGASVVAAFRAEDSPRYHIRAITSDATSPAAVELNAQPNISVVQVDLNSIDSIIPAFEGSTLIFANTNFNFGKFMEAGADAALDLEVQQGLNITQAASRTSSLKHLIWSTMPDTKTMTQGKHVVPHLQSKIPAEQYCLSPESGLSSKTTFVRIGFYGSNILMDMYGLKTAPMYRARVMMLPCAPDVPFPFEGDESTNVGIVAKAIFEQPEKTAGRFVNAAVEMMSGRKWAALWQQALQDQGKVGERVVYSQCSLQAFEELWGPIGTELGLMFQYFDELGEGSFGEGSDGTIALTPADLGIENQLRNTEACLKSLRLE